MAEISPLQSSQEVVPGTSDFDPADINNGIRQLYKVREGWLAPFPWCEEFHFHLDSIFTRLKVVSRKKTRGTATDNIVNMSGIFTVFKPHEECPQPRTVLIEGKPGMGKTTYCKKMAYDWATGKQEAEDCFPRFQTVLLLKCRDMKSDLWEAIDDQLLPRDVEEDVRERFFQYIRQNQSNVLLVFDGLDEIPTSYFPVLVEILQGRVLPKCHVLATAQHNTRIRGYFKFDTLLEIEGFAQNDAAEFIFKYFRDKKNLAEALLSKVRRDKNLRDMVANPLNTTLLCLICEDYGGIPESRAQLYEEIIQCILRRYRTKRGLVEIREDLIEVYGAHLKHVGRIALNGLLEDNLDFEESKLNWHVEELPVFAFLSVQAGGSKIMRPRRHYSFQQKSFQEFFAAFYLCSLLLNEEISVDSIVADRKFFHELKEVVLFLFRMLAARKTETAIALVKIATTKLNQEVKTDRDDILCVLQECIKECGKDQKKLVTEMADIFGSVLKPESPSLASLAE